MSTGRSSNTPLVSVSKETGNENVIVNLQKQQVLDHKNAIVRASNKDLAK